MLRGVFVYVRKALLKDHISRPDKCFCLGKKVQRRKQMDIVDVREIFRNREQYLGKEVTVGGWVRSIRDSKTFGFIVLHDGTFFEPIQIVYHDALPNFDAICKTNVGAALIVTGLLRSRQRKSFWKAIPHRTIRFRRSVTASST